MTSVAQIHIDGCCEYPGAAGRALLERADGVRERLTAKVALVRELELLLHDRDAAQASLVSFCHDQLLRHIGVTDRVLYAAAANATETRLLVRALRTQHRVLGRYVGELERAETPEQTSEAAHAIAVVFAACVELERSVLFPVLLEFPGTDLLELVARIGSLEYGQEIPGSDLSVRGR